MLLLLGLFNHPTRALQTIIQSPVQQSNRMFKAVIALVVFSTVLNLSVNHQLNFNRIGLESRIGMVFIVTLLVPILLYFSRFFWTVVIRFGLLIVAPEALRVEQNIRKSRTEQLKKIYAYVTMISIIPSFLAVFSNHLNQPGTNGHLFLAFLFDVFYIILLVCLQIYIWILNVKAIQLIYAVSAPRAFFGPLLAGIMISVVLGIVLLIISLLVKVR